MVVSTPIDNNPPSSSEITNTQGTDEQSDAMNVDYQVDGIDGESSDSFGDFGSSSEDFPEYVDLEHESQNISQSSAQGVSESPRVDSETTLQEVDTLSNNNCIICTHPKQHPDFATCGKQSCHKKLLSLQGLELSRSIDPRPSSSSSSRVCPVCNNSKSSADTTCGRGDCNATLRFWQGLPNPGSSPTSSSRSGSFSYSAAAQSQSKTRSGGPMCAVCHQRPRYSKNGKTYPTCGLACAAKFHPSAEMCDFCRQRPKVVLNGKTYPHCGRTCRDKANAAAVSNGIDSGTCTTCLNCWKAPVHIVKDEFCSDVCRDIIEHKSPLLLEVPRGHSSFNEIEQEFKSSWSYRRAPCPSIRNIYMVCITKKQEANYVDYGKKVTSTYGLFSKKKDEFRWIPGLRKCPLGHPGMTTPCEKPQCPLCNVLRGTYDPEIHGKGISTMSLPRATQAYDRWAHNIRFKISKVVVLSRVYLGKVVELESFQARPVPPHGANSVKIVNYLHNSRIDADEILVYNCEALRPIYLISYE